MTLQQRKIARRMREAARDTVLAINTGHAGVGLAAHDAFVTARLEMLYTGSDYQPTCIEAAES